jgi:hypothetical protein
MRIGDRMLDLLSDESRWLKGDYADRELKKFCLVGAYGKLTRKNPFYSEYTGFRTSYLGRCLRVIREQFPDRLYPEEDYVAGHYDIGDMIISFNDHEDTTFEDVRLVMEKVR